MDNMKLYNYALRAASDEATQYQRIVAEYKGKEAADLARKKFREVVDDMDDIKTRIKEEKHKQMVEAARREVERLEAEHKRKALQDLLHECVCPVDYEVLVETKDKKLYFHFSNEHDAIIAYEKALNDMKLSKQSSRVSLMREYKVLKSADLL